MFSRRRSDFVVFIGHPRKPGYEKWKRNLWKIFHRNTFKSLFAAFAMIVLIVVVIKHSFFIRAETAKFYPNVCLGGWENPKNAEGKPELPEGASAEEFSDKNSAVLGNIVSQIYCSGFAGEIPKDVEMKNLVLKISWSPELGVSIPSNGATTTLTVNPSDDASSNIQKIMDAPASTTLEILPEDSTKSIATTTVIVNPNNDESSNIQKILDAPSDAVLEISPKEEKAKEQVNDGTTEQSNDRTIERANDGTTEQSNDRTSEPSVPVAEPATSDPAPVSFFKQFFRFAFAEEASDTEHGTRNTEQETGDNGTTTTVAPFVIPSEEGIQKTVTTLDPRMREDDGRRDGTTTDEVSGNSISIRDDSATTSNEYQELVSGTTTSDISSSPEFLEVLYTLDGATWQRLGKVSRTEWTREFKIPVTAWDDISKLQVSIQSLPSIDALPKVYLDGMWLEAEYEKTSPEPKPEPFELDKNAKHSCAAKNFTIDVGGKSEATAELELQGERSFFETMEIGNLPSGMDITFEKNSKHSYDPGRSEDTALLKIINGPGSQKGNFSIPIIYKSGKSATVCQINVINL